MNNLTHFIERNTKGQFVKGCSGFTGKHTEETKKKISKTWFKKGQSPWNKGLKYKSKPCSELRKRKISKAQLGNKNHSWKGGITPLRGQIYNSSKWTQWRFKIFTRDEFNCKYCKKTGNLVAHHLKSFSEIIKEYKIKTLKEALDCKELWNINNGISLCKECHLITPNYGNRKK